MDITLSYYSIVRNSLVVNYLLASFLRASATASILAATPEPDSTAALYSALFKNSFAAFSNLPALINSLVKGLPDNEPLYHEETICCFKLLDKLSKFLIPFFLAASNFILIFFLKSFSACSTVTESFSLLDLS